jgi:hypothetical protein
LFRFFFSFILIESVFRLNQSRLGKCVVFEMLKKKKTVTPFNYLKSLLLFYFKSPILLMLIIIRRIFIKNQLTKHEGFSVDFSGAVQNKQF